MKIEYLIEQMDKHGLPRYMADGLYGYVQCGRSTGSFLQAILMNDFIGACMVADSNNKNLLWNWGMFLHETLPPKSYGSRSAYIMWTNTGGLKAKED